MKNINKINEDLASFWNEAYKKETDLIEKEQIMDLAPSTKLCDALQSLNDKYHVLDYGCGSGWASLIMAISSNHLITAVDIIENSIKCLNQNVKHLALDSKIKPKLIEPTYLKKEDAKKYDAIFTSNVLDVIPLVTSLDIIKEFNRILKDDGKLIISMNYYLSRDDAKIKSIELIDGQYLFVDGILRLNSLSDESWIKIFNKYFVLEKLDYFAWPNETKETRRLFYLRKKHE